jgi:hypothetical protein
VIASNEVGRTDGQGAWPELLEFLNACCHSPDVLQREIGFFVISELLSPMDMDEGEAVDVVETMGVTTEQLYVLFAAAVQDTQSLNVQVSAVVYVHVLVWVVLFCSFFFRFGLFSLFHCSSPGSWLGVCF